MRSLADPASVCRLALGLEMSSSETVSTQPIHLADLSLALMRHRFEFATKIQRMPFGFARDTLVLRFGICDVGSQSGVWPFWWWNKGFLVR